MTWNEFINLIILIEVIVAIGLFIWAIPAIIDGILLARRRGRFGRELSRLFDLNKLDRKQIEILSKEFFLSAKDIQLALRWQFKECISSKEIVSDKVQYFQNLFEDYEKDEPFEGLPPDVRLHLERVRDVLGKEKDHMLQPLASQLQELNDENTRKNKRMWRVSVASLMIGITSLAFATYTYYGENKPITTSILTPEKRLNDSVENKVK